MRRILLVSTAAMVMALMTVAMALPAFAKNNCKLDETGEFCEASSGGFGSGGGGSGGGFGAHGTYDPNAPEGEPHVVIQGGGGQGGQEGYAGGSGVRCVSYTSPNTFECVGHPEAVDSIEG